ncbi:hypothetical protein [Acinetobacter pittii]|uniref:hypothetical protein n=1 Tax=Acinetobacter pittii TaxID=48296 RepID=UPI00355C0688
MSGYFREEHFELLRKLQNQLRNKNDNAQDIAYGTLKEANSLIYAELSGDFPLGDSRQPIYKSLRPFDLVS